jgi:hypothetical protein
MSATLQAVLDAHAVTLPGRDAERARLLALVTGERPLFACVHGIAGIGKSALLRAFACDAREHGARVLAFDCGAFEPTERGFLEALGDELGTTPPALGELAARLGPGRVVLVLDGYEQGRLLDHWIRRRLVPALPAGARLLVADREEPSGWRRSFGELAMFLRLGSLAPAAAAEVLARAGVTGAAAQRVERLAKGHPLALQLAAALPDAPLSAVEQLSALYLHELAPPVRRALEAACEVRRPTASALAAMLGHDDDSAFEALRALPFVELRRDGLAVHDTVRAVTVALRSAADPAARRRDRSAAWAHLREEARTAGRAEQWRVTADMLYLIEQPAIREAFFPTGVEAFAVEPATPADRSAIEAIGARHESPAALAHLRAWLREAPGAFRVARSPDGTVAAFLAPATREDVPHALYREDPVMADWRETLRADPVPPGGRVLITRWALAAGSGERPSPAAAALWLDIKRDLLELRPALRRIHLTARDLRALCPALTALGYGPVSPVGDRSLAACDLGPGSTDGWLAGLLGEALGGAPGDDALDAERRELRLGGRRVELSPREWELLAYLRARSGRPVARDELARDVWGHAWTGGSANAIEAVVSSLRRKLGDRAGALQTVRGVGYRLEGL